MLLQGLCYLAYAAMQKVGFHGAQDCHFIFRFTLVFFILLYVCYPANELKYNFNPLISNYTIILLFCYESLICSNKLLRFFPIIPFGYKSWTYLYFVCIIKVHINGDKRWYYIIFMFNWYSACISFKKKIGSSIILVG